MSHILGYDDAKDIAREDGMALVDSEYEEPEISEEEYEERELAGKYVRYFTMDDEDTFAIVAEAGLNRSFETLVSDDRASVLLTVRIPIPPDALVQAAGYHAATVSLSNVDETFHIPAPRLIAKKEDGSEKKVIHYPNQQTPLWYIFKFTLSKSFVESPLSVATDLEKKLLDS